jgi:hypothetical protein
MKYNMENHRWELTIEAYTNLLHYEGLQEDSNFKRLNSNVSRDIYRLIKKHSTTNAFIVKEYYISLCKELRQTMLEALLAQADASVSSGIGQLKNQHGVNLEKGVAIDLSRIRGISGFAEESYDLLLDKNLLYTGYIPMILDETYKKGVDY